jgi:hypothetical protein
MRLSQIVMTSLSVGGFLCTACGAQNTPQAPVGGTSPAIRDPRAIMKQAKAFEATVKPPIKLDIPGPDDSSPWFRTYRAGEDAFAKGDLEQAKSTWLMSLTALEKSPPADRGRDPFFLVKISALERHLTESYPTDWSKFKDDPDSELKIRQEQTITLYRIARINERLVPADDLLRIKSAERYQVARRDYDKLVKEHQSDKAKQASAQAQQ